MTSPIEHYERLLARHYTWMFNATFEEKVSEQAALLRACGVTNPGLAVDLGCGPGFQAHALVDLGADEVHAIDASATLLAELAARIGVRPIVPHQMDLLRFGEVLPRSADTIICMGDTLTHLTHEDDVRALFKTVSERLSSRGRFVLSWRDLSSPPTGLDRFIPVRASDDKVMICFLENCGQTVLVHDIIQEREADGWRLSKSVYPKLKLPPDSVAEWLVLAGLAIDAQRSSCGMQVIAGIREASL